MKPAALDHNAVVASLKGQTLRVPNLKTHFEAWPPARTNPHYPDLIPFVNRLIDDLSAAQPLVQKRKNDDIALATSLWYPCAGPQELRALASLTVWLICWDDAVDADEGDLARDFERAEEWRARTLRVAKGALGLGPGEAETGQESGINGVLVDFGRQLDHGFAKAQRERVFDEIRFFIQSCGLEQKLRLQKVIPNYDSYMEVRLGTVAASLVASLVEYGLDMELPPQIPGSPVLRDLWMQTSVMGSLVNDLLSLKKELGTDCAINAVAALLTPNNNLDDVVQELDRKLRVAVEEFDAAAGRLLALVDEDDGLKGSVMKYIDGCRAVVTGILEFTLRSPRYRIAELLQEDGSLEIVL